jgi:hypothetical protein
MILHNIRPGGQPHLRMGILPAVLFSIHIQFALANLKRHSKRYLGFIFIVYGGRSSTDIHLGGLVCHTDVVTSF